MRQSGSAAPSARADSYSGTRALPREIRTTAEMYQRAMRHHFESQGIRFNHYMYLRVLWNDDGLSQSELSARVNRAGANTVAVLNSLQKKGLVRRVPSRTDRRTVHVFLTPRGRALKDVVLPPAMEVMDSALEGIAPAEIEAMRDVLRRMRANLQR